jgi:hypothetical protein
MLEWLRIPGPPDVKRFHKLRPRTTDGERRDVPAVNCKLRARALPKKYRPVTASNASGEQAPHSV